MFTVKRYPGLWANVEWALCPGIQRSHNLVPDLSRNGHDAPDFGNAGAVRTESGSGSWAWDLDGSGDYLSLNDTANWAPGHNATISCWARIDVVSGAQRYVWGRNVSGNIAGCFGFVIDTSLTPDKFKHFLQDGSSQSEGVMNSAWPTATWGHIVAKWDGTDHEVWIDGVKQTTSGSSLSIAAHGSSKNIGWGAGNGDNDWGSSLNGALDDFAGWNRALSDDEIRTLYQLGRGGWHAERVVLPPNVWAAAPSTYTGSATLTAPTATVTGSGTHTDPVFTGSATLTAPTATVTGSGTFAVVYTGSSSATAPTPTVTGSGTFTPPNYTGSATLTLPMPTTTGAGVSERVGTATLTVPTPYVHTAFGLASGGNIYFGLGDATMPMPTLTGSGSKTPPTFSPLKRRAPVQGAELRRRGVVQDDTLRRDADEHQDEKRPPR